MTIPSYVEVGASVTWPLPDGYDHLHERRRLGGPGTFDAARDALFSWAATGRRDHGLSRRRRTDAGLEGAARVRRRTVADHRTVPRHLDHGRS